MMAILSAVDADMQGMPGVAQGAFAESGQPIDAHIRQQNGGGAGRHGVAENGQADESRPPPKGLSKSRREAKGYMALKSARAVSHLGWLANATIPQGPRIIDLRWRDVAPMVKRMRRELGKNAQVTVALMAIEAHGHKLGVVPPDSHWIDHMPADLTRYISDKTEKDALGEMAVDWFNLYGRTMLKTIMETGNAA